MICNSIIVLNESFPCDPAAESQQGRAPGEARGRVQLTCKQGLRCLLSLSAFRPGLIQAPFINCDIKFQALGDSSHKEVSWPQKGCEDRVHSFPFVCLFVCHPRSSEVGLGAARL